MERSIGQAVVLLHAGDREEARNRLLRLWERAAENGAPVHRCTIAHYLADTQDDPACELAWDLRALSAADEAAGERPRARGADRPLSGFRPSLHLNLAADYEKLGLRGAASAELRRARAASQALAGAEGDAGPYAAGVRSAIDRLARRLADGGGQPP
ncbi:hypothetical protein HCK00_13785 [Streptomyces sp. PLAI1-29]|uniref:Tetratricopeptide repeat protein n=1 Tax=Streptomyces zingiberis TaxID=2053010 RepID=A0ABX1BV67_9ACTN|nr:hypothetical protein [Streptomyces zingiberis]NJQ01566.1 hypothetical protein [Streptomyces zingiberis]